MWKINLNRILPMILILLLGVQIAIVSVFGSFGTWIAQQQEEKSVDYMLKMNKTNLDKALSKIENDLQDILARHLTLNKLKDPSGLQRWHASTELSSFLKDKILNNQEVDSYIISDHEYNTFLVARGERISYEDLGCIQLYLHNMDDSDIISSGWTSALIDNKGYLQKYYNFGGLTITALVSSAKIWEILSYGQDEEHTLDFFVTNADREIICASDPAWKYGQKVAGDAAPVLREQAVMDGTYYIMGNLQKTGIGAQTPYFFIILFLMVMSFFMLAYLRRFMKIEVIEPIKVLARTSQDIQQGNLSVRPDFKCSNQQMDELKKTYIMMLDTIMDLKVQQYEKLIKVKDSELKYMHMQLKPHFFLNALSTINSMAYKDRNEEIHEFIQIFSDNIRYMFRAGLHTVPLREEVAHVNKYLDMQKLLYRESFYAYMEVPEEVADYQVPIMILHTFFENIFKHAIDICSFITIFLNCSMDQYQDQRMLKIEIQNTGKQFDEQVLAAINSDKKSGVGIGLKHTKEMLSIMYGIDQLLFLENEEPEGAKVTIWIPEKEIREV